MSMDTVCNYLHMQPQLTPLLHPSRIIYPMYIVSISPLYQVPRYTGAVLSSGFAVTNKNVITHQ